LAAAVLNMGDAADVTVVMGQLVPHGLALQVIIHTTVSLLLVVGLRLVPRTVQDVMAWTCPCKEMAGNPPRRTLVCGSGIGCTLFLTRRSYCAMDRSHCFQVVGVLDDDRNLHGRYIQGYRVLGAPEDLPGLLERYRVEQIVVTDTLNDGAEALFDVAGRHKIPVLNWSTRLTPASVPSAGPAASAAPVPER
jgi:FlaA1/EpsC-like NDP-sugar epimerase